MHQYDWLVHVPLDKKDQAPVVGEVYVVGEVHLWGSTNEASFTLVRPQKALPPSDPHHCPVCGTQGHIAFADRVGGTGHFKADPTLRLSQDRAQKLSQSVRAAIDRLYAAQHDGLCQFCKAGTGQMHQNGCAMIDLYALRDGLDRIS